MGKNIGGYHGDSIDIHSVLRQIDAAVENKNWISDRVPFVVGPDARQVEFIAFRRFLGDARHRLYLSTGIHGDEPAGPLAVLRLLEQDAWPAEASIWLCPCLNLTGFPLNRRENAEGVDLNRDYRHLATAEVRAHTGWLGQQPSFDIALCLHEDWESHGFYLYELNPGRRESFAEKIISAVEAVCPIDRSEIIENWPASGGIIRPNMNPADRPRWAEAIYLVGSGKTSASYTLEAPSDFPLETRVNALVAGVRAVLSAL